MWSTRVHRDVRRDDRRIAESGDGASGVQAVFGINFLRFDARSRLCAPRLGTGFAATVSRTPSPRMVEGPINSFHRQVARRPRNAETTESTADEP